MKLLIYCPMYPGERRIKHMTLDSIFALDCGQHKCDVVFGGGDANTTKKYNEARRMLLDGKYDAMLTVEADMVIPAITLQRLYRVNADVIYGLYVSRHSKKWLVFDELAPTVGSYACDTADFPKNAWGKVVESKGVGLGCTLIKHNVLENIPFRDGGLMSCDWYFSLECEEKGFTQKHDLGVVCGHIDGGEVLWPSLGPKLVYYEPMEGDAWRM